MKKFVAVLFLVFCSTSVRAADKPNPADYVVKVHISASHLKAECVNGLCSNILYVNSILNGKKIELSGTAVNFKRTLMLFAPGDYSAKLIKDVHNSDGSQFNQEYDLLFPDDTVWRCFTTGISE
ncbi:MAG: hypothetical protein ABSG51_10695 [Terracidiphilus sp.]|jgi:hypothetical protein